MYIRTKKDVFLAFIMAAAAMALVYGWYAAVGVVDLASWGHGLRNLLAGVVCVFLAELAMGRTVLHPSWRPGLIIFYFWLFTFSFIEAKSAGGTIRVEMMNNDALTLMPVLVLTALLEAAASYHRKAKPVLLLFNFLLIGYLSLSDFFYLTYYKIFGAGFTPTDMISVLLTNRGEAGEFLQSHIGFGSLAFTVVLFLIYMACIAYFLLRGSEAAGKKEGAHVRLRQVAAGVLILGAFITIAHWIPRIFPAWPYHVASKYLTNSRQAAAAHEKNLEKFHFTGGAPEKLPGTVIVVIGESANRDHLQAFNPAYPADTTPWLSSEKESRGFYLMRHAYTNYPLTAQALSMFLTDVNQYNKRPLGEAVTLTDVAKAAGYDTWWISNQTPSAGNVMLAVSARSSAHELWTKQTTGPDMKVVDLLSTVPEEGSHFIIIHLEGSHDRYRDRVPADFDGVHVDGAAQKINDYDSSIKYTDSVLQHIYEYARDHLHLQAMVYCSDHGEDMQYFHGDARFTWDMARVPFFVYLSPDYTASHQAVADNLRGNENKIFTNDLMFDTVCGLLGAPNTGYDPRWDLTSASYSLTKDQALTKHGAIRVADDPALGSGK